MRRINISPRQSRGTPLDVSVEQVTTVRSDTQIPGARAQLDLASGKIQGVQENVEQVMQLIAASAGPHAKSFGYGTFWCNRLKLPTEQLDLLPDAAGDDMTDWHGSYGRLRPRSTIAEKLLAAKAVDRAQQWRRRWRRFSTREALSVRRRYGLSRIRKLSGQQRWE